MTKAEEILINLIKEVLNSDRNDIGIPNSLENHENAEAWDRIIELASKHRVLPLIYDTIIDYGIDEYLSPDNQKRVKHETEVCVVKNLRLLQLTNQLNTLFVENGINSVFLKGVTISRYYEVPECRKSGDVDVLLKDDSELEKAAILFDKEGLIKEDNQPANHHVVYITPDGISVELHTMFSEPFDNEQMNICIKNIAIKVFDGEKQAIVEGELSGTIFKSLNDTYLAYSLLVHMLQHYLRAGFGLKLLCDWVVLWNTLIKSDDLRKVSEEFIDLVRISKIKGFSDFVTALCVHFLGLNRKILEVLEVPKDLINSSELSDFMEDILRAEEFGHSENSRMVSLRGGRIVDYLREFHHQMKLRFTSLSKFILLWPVLWVITLVAFLVNNVRIRQVSLKDVLVESGKRGRITSKMKLFE